MIGDQELQQFITQVFQRYDRDRSGYLDGMELTNFFNDVFKQMGNNTTFTQQQALNALRAIDQNNGEDNKEDKVSKEDGEVNSKVDKVVNREDGDSKLDKEVSKEDGEVNNKVANKEDGEDNNKVANKEDGEDNNKVDGEDNNKEVNKEAGEDSKEDGNDRWKSPN